MGHFVTTRQGGVSAAPFDSLNLSRSVGDAPDALDANWARVRTAVGAGPDSIAIPDQCHGTTVLTIERVADAQAEPADGLVTTAPGLVLAVLVADCAPVLAADAKHGVVGIAHAGWRGTVAGITPALIHAMVDAGASPPDIHLAVGPCIGYADYEIGEEVARSVRAAFPPTDWPVLLRPSLGDGATGDLVEPSGRAQPQGVRGSESEDRWLFDLGAANVRQAVECGLVPAQVSRSPWSTKSAMDRFFSHRGSGGRTGRFAAGVWLS